MLFSLAQPVSKLHLCDSAAEKALNYLGLRTVDDLLRHFPRDWQDLSRLSKIAEIKPNEKFNLKAKIKKLQSRRTPRRRLHILEGLLEDDTGGILAVWFNQPFLLNQLREGREYFFSGKAQINDAGRRLALQLQNPSFELVKEQTIHTAGIIPLYELTENLTQKLFRYFLKQALPLASKIPEHLPLSLLAKLSLLSLPEALRQIHFPENADKLAKARLRLAFDELFLFQLALLSYRRKLKVLPSPQIAFNKTLIQNFVRSLPFRLTLSQRLAVWEILRDLGKAHPMNRLLEGEVGSGKTVVAGIAMLEAAESGWQSVLLAPTEILAWQHYETVQKLFENNGIKTALLTRSHKISSHKSPFPDSRKGEEELLEKIASGEIKIVVGTHALLQDKMQFQNIGLLVVDEQHRFGVRQRALLTQRGTTLTETQINAEQTDPRNSAPPSRQSAFVPHLLTMTATPIPRTLALALYGDLDISALKELPSGRKKIVTRLVEPKNREIAYEFIRKHLAARERMYVVTPLIEESDKLGAKSAKAEAERLKKIFPEFAVGLLHGRLKGEEKKQIMADFKFGKLQILATTTVIEVGVDVPEATIMLIENAERFGLSQLHQLRGRVGRSDLQSYCLLFSDEPNEFTRKRLLAVVESADGFELAEKDLELRGAGEILGSKQSGFIPFKIAKFSDRRLIKLARAEAENLLNADSSLTQYPLLRNQAETLAKDAHLE